MLPFNFNWPPIELIIGVCIAAWIRFKSSLTLGFWQAATTTFFSFLAGVGLYQPVSDLFSLDPVWHVPVAVVLALILENLLKGLLDFSKRPDAFARILKAVFSRDPMALTDEKKGKDDKDG